MRKEEARLTSVPSDAGSLELRAILRPAEYFSHPQEVLDNALLDVAEKRAILASWASDLYAVESQPALRQLPGTRAVVSVQAILSALKSLDGDPCEDASSGRWLSGMIPKIRPGEWAKIPARTSRKKISQRPLELQN